MIIRILSILLLILSTTVAYAQREVTPVITDDKKPAQPTLHYYDKHGDPLPEPVLFLATLDTVQNVSTAAKPIYPRLHAIDFGVNFFDGILAIAGQKHGGADVWASLSMWNWLFPTVEVGVGTAKNTPKGNNFTYKGKLSPYFKFGVDYNFLYKSDPKYRVIAGLRACYSTFTYDITDITINSPYWQESNQFSLPGQKSHAWWGEVLAGLRVQIAKPISLGWTFRYHTLFGHPEAQSSSPWYIPGYGSRSSHISVTFSVVYTLPLHRQLPADPLPEQ